MFSLFRNIGNLIEKFKVNRAKKFVNKYIKQVNSYQTNTDMPYLYLDITKKKSFLIWLNSNKHKKILIILGLFFLAVVGYIFDMNIFLFIMLILFFTLILHTILDSIHFGIVTEKIKNKLVKKFKNQCEILRKVTYEPNETNSILLIKSTSADIEEKFESILFSPWLSNIILQLDNIENYEFGKKYFTSKKHINYDSIQECLFEIVESIRKYSYQSELRYQAFLIKEEIRFDIIQTILNEVEKNCPLFNYKNIHNLVANEVLTFQIYQYSIQKILLQLDNLYVTILNEKKKEEEQLVNKEQRLMNESKAIIYEVAELAKKL